MNRLLGAGLNTLAFRKFLLASTSARLSTLGGGHFAVQHTSESLRLALIHRQVALLLNAPELEARCRVFVAYGLLQAGNAGGAESVLTALAASTDPKSDPELGAMIQAALYRVQELRRPLMISDHGDPRTGVDLPDDAGPPSSPPPQPP